ncbi:hypothetical protein WISP_84226 [Willisornis vidua]|uniref:Uncharacterized protein n=1 Tax=Willisornis vidua TaxID=1566151 RepID=A0ABQ9D4Q6_9PASS|nr:hypothetical protein WISP_84226 [Willisornis vidua]
MSGVLLLWEDQRLILRTIDAEGCPTSSSKQLHNREHLHAVKLILSGLAPIRFAKPELVPGVPLCPASQMEQWIDALNFTSRDSDFGYETNEFDSINSVATGNLSGVMLQHAKHYISKCHGLVLTPKNPVYIDKAYSEKEGEMQRQMT